MAGRGGRGAVVGGWLGWWVSGGAEGPGVHVVLLSTHLPLPPASVTGKHTSQSVAVYGAQLPQQAVRHRGAARTPAGVRSALSAPIQVLNNGYPNSMHQCVAAAHRYSSAALEFLSGSADSVAIPSPYQRTCPRLFFGRAVDGMRSFSNERANESGAVQACTSSDDRRGGDGGPRAKTAAGGGCGGQQWFTQGGRCVPCRAVQGYRILHKVLYWTVSSR